MYFLSEFLFFGEGGVTYLFLFSSVCPYLVFPVLVSCN